MKSIAIFSLILTMISSSHPAFAAIDPAFKGKIEKACLASQKSAKPTLQNFEKVCVCVAKTHYESALQEPVEKEAVAQLNWVVAYYSTKNPIKLKQLANRPENLVDYDLQVIEDCMESAKNVK